MTELHKGTSFVHSCVKVPVDPYSRQPTPAYDRPCPRSRMDKHFELAKIKRRQDEKSNKSSARFDNTTSTSPDDDNFDSLSFLEFIQSIPDYEAVHHLSNEQFKQKIDYLKRKQRMLLKNLRNCLEQDIDKSIEDIESTCCIDKKIDNRMQCKSPCHKSITCLDKLPDTNLSVKGKSCNLEESRCNSPLCPAGTFSRLAEDQDFLTYRWKEREKAAKTRLNEDIMNGKYWSSGSDSKSIESLDSLDREINNIETKSLPPCSPKRNWQPTLPKPFSFTLRDDAEKYMSQVEQQAKEEYESSRPSKKKKRRIRPVPLTSKIPLYDKLMAEKEERSRLNRVESALNLMSQVRPFKLECDLRAHRALTRSSPELYCSKSLRSAAGDTTSFSGAGFKAKPVPRNLFSTDVYDRMLEDEYFRHLKKRIRAAELLKSSSLPPSMARRERCKSAVSFCSQNTNKSSSDERAPSNTATATTTVGRDSVTPNRASTSTSERFRSSIIAAAMPPHGTNLAAILRAQASREKLEREVQQRLEEKRHEQMLRLRKALIGRKPAWRALRSAARHDHERDLDIRVSLRRDEAREQAELHKLQMEMMLDRVTRIPTLFERYSQSFQMSQKLFPELYDLPDTSTPLPTKKKKKKKKFASKRLSSSSAESYMSFGSSSRPNSGSLASSSPLGSSSSGNTHKTTISQFISKFNTPTPTIPEKKKNDRGPLKVSINEKAELIDDLSHIDKYEDYDDRTYSIDSACSHMHEEREKHTLEDENMKDKNGKKEKVKDENVKHEKTKDTEISNGIEREG